MLPVSPAHRHRAFRLLLLAASAALVSGCSGATDPRAYNVQGTVTFEGKPVPAGTIQFVPAKGNSGPAGFATIVDGRFDTAAPGGKGTVGGLHQATVNGFDGKANPDKELPVGMPLFQDYQLDLDLPMENTTLEIVAEQRRRATTPKE